MGKQEISLERFWDRPLPDLLHALEEWRPVRVEKWLDQETR